MGLTCGYDILVVRLALVMIPTRGHGTPRHSCPRSHGTPSAQPLGQLQFILVGMNEIQPLLAYVEVAKPNATFYA